MQYKGTQKGGFNVLSFLPKRFATIRFAPLAPVGEGFSEIKPVADLFAREHYPAERIKALFSATFT